MRSINRWGSSFGLCCLLLAGLSLTTRPVSAANMVDRNMGNAENDGSGKSKQKNLRIKYDQLGSDDVLTYKTLSGTFKFWTIHARYPGGVWRDIYKGSKSVSGSYLISQVMKLKAKTRNVMPTEYVIAVNGFHTRFEKTPCVISVIIRGPAPSEAGTTVSKQPQAEGSSAGIGAVLLAMQKAAKSKDKQTFAGYMLAKVQLKAAMIKDKFFPRDQLALLLCDPKNQIGSPFQLNSPIDKCIYTTTHRDGNDFVSLVFDVPLRVDMGMGAMTTRQPLPALWELEFTKSNGKMQLKSFDIMTQGYLQKVYMPFAQKIQAANGKEDAAAIAQYRRDFKAFLATIKRAGGSAPGTGKTPVNVNTAIDPNESAGPAPVVDSGTPKRKPVIITAKRLKNPTPVVLPADRVTPVIRKARKVIDNFVNRSFPDFKGTDLLENRLVFDRRDLYFKVFLRLFEMMINGKKYTLNDNLVFYVDGTGKVKVTRMPVVRLEDRPPRYNPDKPYWKPDSRKINLPTPKVAGKNCMVLTNLKKLREKHPANFDAIKRMLDAYGPIIDIGAANINARSSYNIDKYLESKFDRNRFGTLFIFGNDDVVPYGTYTNPLFDAKNPHGDSDPYIESDDYYADFDHDKHQDWDIILTRLPDDKGILEDSDSILYRPVPDRDRPAFTNYVVYGNPVWPDYNVGLAKLGNPSKPSLRLSAPYDESSFSTDFLRGNNVFLNLHGAMADGLRYWGEEKSSTRDNQLLTTAISVDQADARDAIIICTCCYGAYTKGKTSNTSIALRFLKNGARAFIGNSRIGYADTAISKVSPSYLVKWSTIFKRYVDQGLSPQAAFMLAKREYARTMMPGNPIQYKMLHQLLYLGLPPGDSHAPDLKTYDKVIDSVKKLTGTDPKGGSAIAKSSVPGISKEELAAYTKPVSIEELKPDAFAETDTHKTDSISNTKTTTTTPVKRDDKRVVVIPGKRRSKDSENASSNSGSGMDGGMGPGPAPAVKNALAPLWNKVENSGFNKVYVIVGAFFVLVVLLILGLFIGTLVFMAIARRLFKRRKTDAKKPPTTSG